MPWMGSRYLTGGMASRDIFAFFGGGKAGGMGVWVSTNYADSRELKKWYKTEGQRDGENE